MLYARTFNNKLVQDNQMVGYREHMTTEHRILFLTGPLTGDTEPHNLMMALDTISHDPVKLIITSPGGELDSTFLFIDTMKMIKCPVETIGRYCASAAAIILASGAKGKRYLLPHAKVMLHLPAGQMGGDSKDWEIQHKQMLGYKNRIVDILCECGVTKTREEILADIDRDFWLDPQEAIDYGLADQILTTEMWQEWIK